MGMDKREIEDAKKMCMEAADEAEGACKEANKTIKDVQEYCSDDKYNNNMKEGYFVLVFRCGLSLRRDRAVGTKATRFGALVTDMLIDQGRDGMHERQNLYNPLFKYTGVAVCPHAKFGSMTVITYSEDFAKQSDRVVSRRGTQKKKRLSYNCVN